MVEKFESDPKAVIVFLEEEQVPPEVRGELELHLESVCLLIGSSKFLHRHIEQQELLGELVHKFEAKPISIDLFVHENRVPEDLKEELRRVIKTILLLRGAGKTLRKAFVEAGGTLP